MGPSGGRTYTSADGKHREAASDFIVIPNILVWVEGRLILLYRCLLVKSGIPFSKSRVRMAQIHILKANRRISTYSLIPIAKSFLIACLEYSFLALMQIDLTSESNAFSFEVIKSSSFFIAETFSLVVFRDLRRSFF